MLAADFLGTHTLFLAFAPLFSGALHSSETLFSLDYFMGLTVKCHYRTGCFLSLGIDELVDADFSVRLL